MKPIYLLSIILAASLIAGCKSTESSKSTAATSVASMGGLDTNALISAFRNADKETVTLVQEVATQVSKKEYSGALSSLQKIRRIPGLTAAQSDSVTSLISGLNSRVK